MAPMEDNPPAPAATHSLPRNKPCSQSPSVLSVTCHREDGAEASSRAMHEVRRSILRKLVRRVQEPDTLFSDTE